MNMNVRPEIDDFSVVEKNVSAWVVTPLADKLACTAKSRLSDTSSGLFASPVRYLHQSRGDKQHGEQL